MSVAILTLGLAAGYLIQKNTTLFHQLEDSMTQHEAGDRGVEQATPSTATIREIKRTVDPGLMTQDINVRDLPKTDVARYQGYQQTQAETVAAFDAPQGPAQIEGVYLSFDNSGI